jgi:hypothetical protein
VLDVERDELGASERLSAAANPSSSSARSLSPARVEVSSSARTCSSGERSSGAALRSGAVPCRRRIPERTCATAPESHGFGWSCARCSAAIAAAPAGDRDGPEPAVGFGGQERRDRGRRGSDRRHPALGAFSLPIRKDSPEPFPDVDSCWTQLGCHRFCWLDVTDAQVGCHEPLRLDVARSSSAVRARSLAQARESARPSW